MVEIATREDSHKKNKKTACNALCDVLTLSGYHSSPTLFNRSTGFLCVLVTYGAPLALIPTPRTHNTTTEVGGLTGDWLVGLVNWNRSMVNSEL